MVASTMLPTVAVYWVDEAADVEIRDGLACWTLHSGGVEFHLRGTPAVLLESIRRSMRVWNDFARANDQTVVAISEARPRFIAETHD
jgi:hypothetical protein